MPQMAKTLLDCRLPKDAAVQLSAFRDEVRRALPYAVRSVILFGSRARGDAQFDSDYDVAVVLSGDLANDMSVRHRLADAAWEQGSDSCFISVIAVPEESLTAGGQGRSELAMRIVRDGIEIR